jgi:hypothetical protein
MTMVILGYLICLSLGACLGFLAACHCTETAISRCLAVARISLVVVDVGQPPPTQILWKTMDHLHRLNAQVLLY